MADTFEEQKKAALASCKAAHLKMQEVELGIYRSWLKRHLFGKLAAQLEATARQLWVLMPALEHLDGTLPEGAVLVRAKDGTFRKAMAEHQEPLAMKVKERELRP